MGWNTGLNFFLSSVLGWFDIEGIFRLVHSRSFELEKSGKSQGFFSLDVERFRWMIWRNDGKSCTFFVWILVYAAYIALNYTQHTCSYFATGGSPGVWNNYPPFDCQRPRLIWMSAYPSVWAILIIGRRSLWSGSPNSWSRWESSSSKR